MTTANDVLDFECKQGEQLIIAATLYGADGAVANLTGSTVTLKLRKRGSTNSITLAGTTAIVSPTGGTVKYTGTTADTASTNTGEIEFEWVADYGAGVVKKFPDAKNTYLLGFITPAIT
jgi:hypothetical protein